MALRSFKKQELEACCPGVKLGNTLGEGGNARVFAGENHTHGRVAVKFMLNSDTKRYDRFRDEVLVVTTRLKGSRRVVPILESYLPKSLQPNDVPWYVMPSACRLLAYLADKTWHERVQALLELAEGLSELHALDVAHRDIKPDNLFELDGMLRFADFGIAAFPERAGVTEKNEPMGPAHYMAPEMLSSTSADHYKADVFSFAKTLWVVLTGQKYPFPGQYSPRGTIALTTFAGKERFVTEPLDTLLEKATSLDPAQRPTAADFAQRLREVLDIQQDFVRTNHLQWGAAEVEALRLSGLTRAEWHGVDEIAQVIALLSRRHGLNHCFFPSGGGLTIDGASTCEGGAMLSLNMQFAFQVIVKPKRLTLERFPSRQDFSYAVLETDDIKPLGVESRYHDGECEHLKQLNDFDYGPDASDEHESVFRVAGVACQRFFKGGIFVIAPTGGVYNQLDDYQGTANKKGRDELRSLFEKVLLGLNEPQQTEWKTARLVRLLDNTRDAKVSLRLQHISDDLLRRLIEIDDSLFEERRGGSQGLRSASKSSLGSLMEKIARRDRSIHEKAAWDIVATLTPEQRAEYLTLVQVGRRNGNPEDFADIAAASLKMHFEDHYLIEKLGNRYLRKALERFGLEVPPSLH